MVPRITPPVLVTALGLVLAACGSESSASASALPAPATGGASATTTPAGGGDATHVTVVPVAARERADRAPNEVGRIPVFEYHLIGDRNATWERERAQFRQDLELMYDRGYRPVTMAELLDRKLDLPRGISPVVIVFDDASPSQFRYVERGDDLVVDSTSGLGIWLEFAKSRPDWANKAVFCMLPGAEAGRSFFGNKNIEGQKTEWRFRKVRYLHELGFELCNHTLWHANLKKYPDAVVQEQIARGDMAIDSAVPGYRVRTFALPLGVWPKNRALAWQGSWTDPKSGRTVTYAYDAVLEVAGGPTRSPHDPQFNPRSILRIPVMGDGVRRELDRLERQGTAYVSDGDPATVARPLPKTAPVVTAGN